MPAGPQTAATAPAPTPAPPTAAAFLRAGWQVLRAAARRVDRGSPTTRWPRPSPGPAPPTPRRGSGFAADLAAALAAVTPSRPPPRSRSWLAVPAPRSPGDLAPGHAPHRRRREVRPPHLPGPRRALRTVEEGAA